jgi:hypothetical protein
MPWLLLRTPTPKAERIASTEPELQSKIAKALRPLSLVRTVARAARSLLGALLPPARAAALPPAEGGRAWEERVGGGGSGVQKTKSDELAEALTRQELEDFDRRMRERELSQRPRGSRGSGGVGGSGGW